MIKFFCTRHFDIRQYFHLTGRLVFIKIGCRLPHQAIDIDKRLQQEGAGVGVPRLADAKTEHDIVADAPIAAEGEHEELLIERQSGRFVQRIGFPVVRLQSTFTLCSEA